MKNQLFLISIILIYFGCDLIPETLDPPVDQSVRKEYLQPEDTLNIDIESLIYGDPQDGVFSLKDIGDTNIVSLFQSELILTVIGKNFGSTIITAHYSNSDKNQIIYLNFIVLEGLPIFIFVGEDTMLTPADFFDLDVEGIEPDSIFLSSADEINTFIWRNENNQGLVIEGIKPGNQNVLYSVLDTLGSIHEIYLTIETSVRQVVMGEVFTNVGCIPCVPVNHILDEIVEEQNIDVTMVRYHWNSPLPIDPMYDYNPDDVELRRIMYNVPFCPVVVINGVHILNGQGPVENNAHGDVLNESAINNELFMGHTYTLVGDSIVVDLEVRPFKTINDVVRAWAVVVEDSIEFEAYNGELIHMQVMRDLNLGSEWETLVEYGVYTSQLSLLAPEGYSIENPFFQIITMVQSIHTNRIYQSNRIYSPLN